MKICLYSPYIPNHFGGGEKYLFDVALVLSRKHNVSIAISVISGNMAPQTISSIRKNYENFLGVSLKNINFIPTPIGSSSFFLNKLIWTKKFDVIYYQTDGSLFFSLAKKNILHIQVPLILNKFSVIERLKLANWSLKNTNSYFTKKIIEKSWKTKIDVVHHPMLSEDVFLKSPKELNKKEKVILHVGRFFRQQHSKKQEILVDIFKKMTQKFPKETIGWKLVLIGSVEDKTYANKIKKLAKGFPIEIYHEVKREKLLQWYRLSSIYWHTTGYGVNEEKHPEKMEHFGISTAEAMASGCAPIVINKGGQPEVLGENLKSWLWHTKSECIDKTISLIKNPSLRKDTQKIAMLSAITFSDKIFTEKLEEMLK